MYKTRDLTGGITSGFVRGLYRCESSRRGHHEGQRFAKHCPFFLLNNRVLTGGISSSLAGGFRVCESSRRGHHEGQRIACTLSFFLCITSATYRRDHEQLCAWISRVRVIPPGSPRRTKDSMPLSFFLHNLRDLPGGITSSIAGGFRACESSRRGHKKDKV